MASRVTPIARSPPREPSRLRSLLIHRASQFKGPGLDAHDAIHRHASTQIYSVVEAWYKEYCLNHGFQLASLMVSGGQFKGTALRQRWVLVCLLLLWRSTVAPLDASGFQTVLCCIKV